jgi:PKD repeat protein
LLIPGTLALTVDQDLATLSERSDDIVLGTVIGVQSCWTADKANIVTTAQVEVDRNVRSRYSGTMSVTVLGGTVEGISQHVEDQPLLVPGTEAYLFVRQNVKWGTTVVGGRQGVMPVRERRVLVDGGEIGIDDFDRYLRNLTCGIFVAVPDPLAPESVSAADTTTPVIAEVSPATASAGTGTLVTINGSGFGTKQSRWSSAEVGFLYRYRTTGSTPIWASGGPYYSYNSNDIVSWTDTQIVVRIPVGVTVDYYPGSASSGYVWVRTDDSAVSEKVPFTVTFGYGKEKWTTVAPFSVNPGSQGTAAVTAIQNAAGTWNAAIPSSSFRFVYEGTSPDSTFGRDGQSLIYFGPASDFSDDSIIAWASSWSDADGNMIEADIEFNSKWAWTTGTASGDTMNIEAIVLHELGHWLSLRDLYGWVPGYPSDVGKVMFGYSNDQHGNKNLKDLHAADRAGIQWIYGGGTPTVTTTPTSGISAVPGGVGMPNDLDADGLFDDVNGNNRPDFSDVVLFFNQMTWIAENEPLEFFDFNGNGRIDFADTVWLFNAL